MALAGITRIAALAVELLLGADVEQHQVLLAEPAFELRSGRQRVEPGLELSLDRLELDLAGCELVRPGGDAAEQHGHARMARELGELGRRHRADAVAAVINDEPFLAGDAVPAQSQAHLSGERFDHLGIAHRRRRAEHERP